MKSLPQWNPEQKKRAHARIFEELMRRQHMTETQIILTLGDGPRAQSTINRWKTGQVRPNRHVYLDILKNIFHLDYDEIDTMLWLAGMPPMLRDEVNTILGNDENFRDRTEVELASAAYSLLVYVIGNDLGLPPPEEQNTGKVSLAFDKLKFTVDSLTDGQALTTDSMPVIEGQYSPISIRASVWVVLQDSDNNYYLQSPEVNFMPNGRWIASNVIIGHGITSLNFIGVDAQGQAYFRSMVARRRWGAFRNLPLDSRVILSIPFQP